MTRKVRSLPLKITQCSIQDAGAISEVAIRSYKDFYLHLWYDNGAWYIDKSFDRSSIEREILDPNHAFFLLYEKERTVGFLKLNINQPLKGYEDYNCMELERIYLIKSATGKGYGRQAVEFCFQYAANLKKDFIWLKAMDTSSAVSFYNALDFKYCGSLSLNFPQMKEEFRGMVVMMKRLS